MGSPSQANWEGVISDGSPLTNYNPNLHCWWSIRAIDQVRWDLYIEDFDIEKTIDCVNDKVELRQGSRQKFNFYGTFCGKIPKGRMASIVEREILFDFITNGAMEYPGFKIRYKVAHQDAAPYSTETAANK